MFEKKRGTRFLASVMALVMLLSLAPVGALATEGEGQPAENQTVTQPANGVDQKPVETGTANTNEETTPPPPQMRVLQYYLPITTMPPWRSPKRP